MTPPPAVPECITGTLCKVGHRPGENEDAVAVAADALRFAVADGATEGWESGPWARHLAASFVACPPAPATFADWLADARRTWSPATVAGPVPWYVATKQQEGSFATVAGLELRRTAEPIGWGWRAAAVGDSCVFHVRDEVLLAAFPLTSPAAFGNRPALVPSSAAVPCPEPDWLAGRALAGDLLVLATDAVSAQLLHPPAFEPALLAIREAIRTRESAPLLGWLRTVQAATNDDVSLIGVRLPAHREAA